MRMPSAKILEKELTLSTGEPGRTMDDTVNRTVQNFQGKLWQTQGGAEPIFRFARVSPRWWQIYSHG